MVEEKINNLEAMMEIKKQLLDAAYKENNLQLIQEAASGLAEVAFALNFLKKSNEMIV